MTRNSSLAARRYTFGPYTLDPIRRLLWCDGVLVPLTPKTVDVLTVLVERHGQVVDKDDLLRFVWPNAVVEENNLARHISILRKALQQRRGQHDFISTIPGRGYLFVAAVAELDAAAAPDAREPAGAPPAAMPEAAVLLHADAADPAPPAAGPPQRSWIAAAAAVALVVIGAAGGLMYWSRQAAPGRESRTLNAELRQLTFDAGVQRDPTWSPDGAWLAYAADRGGNLDLYRRSLTDPTPLQLTSDPADESQPDWSPDGRSIAFRSEKDGGGVYVMPAAGGAARRVAGFGFFPRWSPDGARVLFRGSMLRGIDSGAFVVSADGSGLAAVRPDLLRQFRAPHIAWHPDGRRVSIGGRRDRSKWSFVTASISGTEAIESPSAARLADELRSQSVTLGRFVWSASARHLYFEGRSADAQGVWRVDIEPGSLAWKSTPERMSTGPAEYTDLALSPDATRLAFTVRHDRTRVWSFPFAPEDGHLIGSGQPVTPGGPAEYDAAAPLDGSKVAYRTVRGGRHDAIPRRSDGPVGLAVPERNGNGSTEGPA
jgi:DNA-binding winged helix-turn-helix (wHTH) protein